MDLPEIIEKLSSLPGESIQKVADFIKAEIHQIDQKNKDAQIRFMVSYKYSESEIEYCYYFSTIDKMELEISPLKLSNGYASFKMYSLDNPLSRTFDSSQKNRWREIK